MNTLSRLSRLARQFRNDRRGNFALIFSLSLIPFVLLVGTAVDMARLTQSRADLQSAMDSAVLAAVSQTGTLRATAAANFLSANAPKGITLGTPSWTTNSNNSFTGAITGTLQTSFFSIANIHSLGIAASSTAVPATSATDVCILVKNASSSQAFLANSGAVISAPNCEIDVASTGSPAAMLNSGASFSVTKFCVKSASVTNNGASVTDLVTSCQTATDPFAGTLPAVTVGSCTVSNQNYSGTTSLNPGTYCGNFNFNGSGTLNLAAGLYIFSGTKWNLNSGWTITGTGVTFYFADSNSYIQINSGAALKISAPTTGTYANILIYEPTGLSTSSFSVDGGSGHLLTGLIYLPSRNITFNAMSNMTSDALTLVVDELILDSLNWDIAPGAKTIGASGSSGSSGSYLSAQ